MKQIKKMNFKETNKYTIRKTEEQARQRNQN